ncbi:hypothetical protein [Clostridium beijerinckii]|uniref:hypothetical protein n=1 Tax=Clostridium beijerinckii TaxID=1520 RepID=UPI0015706B7C|nr:hypothetical protein [Clostridium beijerinckii]NRU52492.1 hypothetical protein [Clostridium beijerinckii]NYC69063.1 hypothetical protein [Clostridium beijerinckii]NYC91693.1 hypothetical protein [Clostridium beijerinckii]
MINANMARKQTKELINNNSTDELKHVEELIHRAMKKGEYETQPIGGVLKDSTIKKLKELGYKIELGGFYCRQTIIKW